MPVTRNISTVYTCRDEGGQGDLHPISNAAIAWKKDRFEWVGKESNLPETYQNDKSFNADGCIIIPGLADCHTHLCFGGWRAEEFEKRIGGKSYLEIAKAGGGILSTVKSTRAASEADLYKKASGLLSQIISSGVTSIECKSGYGLTLEDELKQLRVYKRLAENYPVHIQSTFLGAHAVPSEFTGDRKSYIDLVISKMIPAVSKEKLATFCDIFVEESAFTVDEARKIFKVAKRHGLIPKLHADQLSSGGGAELAAEIEAISADHLEQISDNGIQKMAEAGVLAVTLPIASLYTQQPYLNCRKLVNGGLQVAVASDFNPGSAPSFDLRLAMLLTCNHGRLTPAETLKGATIYAAKAMGIDRTTGSIEPNKSADFIVLNAPNVNFWLYHHRPEKPDMVFIKGKKQS